MSVIDDVKQLTEENERLKEENDRLQDIICSHRFDAIRYATMSMYHQRDGSPQLTTHGKKEVMRRFNELSDADEVSLNCHFGVEIKAIHRNNVDIQFRLVDDKRKPYCVFGLITLAEGDTAQIVMEEPVKWKVHIN